MSDWPFLVVTLSACALYGALVAGVEGAAFGVVVGIAWLALFMAVLTPVKRVEGEHIIVHGKWLTTLKREMNAADYCFICTNHLSSGHDGACPMIPNQVVKAIR